MHLGGVWFLNTLGALSYYAVLGCRGAAGTQHSDEAAACPLAWSVVVLTGLQGSSKGGVPPGPAQSATPTVPAQCLILVSHCPPIPDTLLSLDGKQACPTEHSCGRHDRVPQDLGCCGTPCAMGLSVLWDLGCCGTQDVTELRMSQDSE